MQEFLLFDFVFNDEELENEFQEFFNRYDLTRLFNEEGRAGSIRVSWTEARAVVNGKYARDLLDLSDILQIADDNKKYEEAVFRIIFNARSIQGMMNNIRKINQHVHNDIGIGYLFNTWNIVWYNKELA